MKHRMLIIYIFCIAPLINYAQDPLFSQFYHSPVYLNPGFAGCSKNTFRAAYASRLQWMNLPDPMQYHTLALDWFIRGRNTDPNISSGFIFNHFSEGYIRTTQASLLFAKNFGSNADVEKPWFLNVGVQAGRIWKSVNKDKLLFADQLTQNGPNGQPSQAELLQFARKGHLDISAGAVFTYGNMMIGGAWHHMTTPENGLIGDSKDSKLESRYTAHISFIHDTYSNNEGAIVYKPTLIINKQGISKSFLVGSLFDLPDKHIELGVWYRNNWDFSNSHSLVIGLNIKFGKERNYYTSEGNDRYRAGFSYDGELTKKPGIRSTSGSSEIGLLYESPSEYCPKPSGSAYGRYPWEFH